MAILNTQTYLDQISGNPRKRLDAQVASGEVRFIEIPYVTTAAEVAGDILNVYQLNNGVVVLPEQSWVASEGIGGTGVTISKLGDAVDDDRYSATAIALTAAGLINPLTPNMAASVLVRTPTNSGDPLTAAPATNVLKAVLAGTLPVTAGKKVIFGIAFRLP
jgi:hypothetical protein